MKDKAFTILLVEDNMAHAEIVRRNIKRFNKGLILKHVNDGCAAIDYLYHEGLYSNKIRFPRPGLILLDLRLPKVDGFEVLKKIKMNKALLRIPVLILTSSAGRKDLEKAYAYHANGYLVKPVDFVRSVDLMKTVCRYWVNWNLQPA